MKAFVWASVSLVAFCLKMKLNLYAPLLDKRSVLGYCVQEIGIGLLIRIKQAK